MNLFVCIIKLYSLYRVLNNYGKNIHKHYTYFIILYAALLASIKTISIKIVCNFDIKEDGHSVLSSVFILFSLPITKSVITLKYWFWANLIKRANIIVITRVGLI